MSHPPSADQRTVLIIGGGGYVGTVLTRLLLSQNYAVTVLDNLLYGQGFAVRQFLNDDRYSFVLGDLRDPTTVRTCLKGATDVVLLAGLVGDPICKAYPELARAVNLDGCRAVFDAAAGQGIDRFVFASTCSNYGLRESDDLATEEAELNPVSLYAECKVAIERHIISQRGEVDFCPAILRIATAYGFSQRMRFDLTVSEFTRVLARGEPLLVYDQDTWRPYCHVLDLARSVQSVLEAERERVDGEVFNVGDSGENFTKRMLVECIQDHLPDARASYKEGGVDPRNYRVSFDKVRTQLDFQCVRSVREEIPKLITAVQSGLFDAADELDPNLYGNYRIDGIT